MSFMTRGLFVVGGIIAGTTALNYFVFGNAADYGLPNSRLGAWREALVRPACYGALEILKRIGRGRKCRQVKIASPRKITPAPSK